MKTAEEILAALIVTDKKKRAGGPTIEECIEKYLASHKHELGEKTYGESATANSNESHFGARQLLLIRSAFFQPPEK